MTNKQILQEAIEKAIKNKWNPIDDMGDILDFKIYRDNGQWHMLWVSFRTKIGDGGDYDIMRILFDIKLGFAKALGYKYANLGAWFDKGKEPLEFLRRFL